MVDPSTGEIIGWDTATDMPVAKNEEEDAIDHPFTMAAGDAQESFPERKKKREKAEHAAKKAEKVVEHDAKKAVHAPKTVAEKAKNAATGDHPPPKSGDTSGTDEPPQSLDVVGNGAEGNAI